MVTVYTSNGCPHCQSVKEFLKEEDVTFEVRNINDNPEYRKRLIQMGYMSVPLTIIGEHKFIGLNIPAMKEALSE